MIDTSRTRLAQLRKPRVLTRADAILRTTAEISIIAETERLRRVPDFARYIAAHHQLDDQLGPAVNTTGIASIGRAWRIEQLESDE